MRNFKGGENMYDYLIVGAGLYGAVFAQQKTEQGFRCLVIDRRNHIAGNIYSEKVEGIEVHRYGPHIFHTANEKVWNYVNRFASFNHFVYSPIANFRGELYNLPFNMNTFSRLWNVRTPKEAKEKIAGQISDLSIKEPENLEEQALSLVGRDVYEKLIKGYTEKQWGRDCRELPAFLIKRLPLRFTYDNNYFNDPYQGIPVGGYTRIIEKLLDGIEVRTGISWQEFLREEQDISYDKLLYTGMIDEYFDYCFGELEYRSLRFETEILEEENYQGNAVVNYTEYEIPYTRIIEHKHFEYGTQPKTVITREYPQSWQKGDEPYYPMSDEKNIKLYEKYQELARREGNVIFGGRLGQYKYFDMDDTVEAALQCAREHIKQP